MNKQENKNTTNGISSITLGEIKTFQANVTQMGFEKALTLLMKDNSKLASEINMVSGGLKEQNPNGPTPVDVLDEAINNLPIEGGVAFVIAQYRGEKTVILKGNEGVLSAVLCDAMSDSSQIEDFLKRTMIVSEMSQSFRNVSINPFTALNPLADFFGMAEPKIVIDPDQVIPPKPNKF